IRAIGVGNTLRLVNALATHAHVAGRAIGVHLALWAVNTLPVQAAIARRAVRVGQALRLHDALAVEALGTRWALPVVLALRQVDALAVLADVAGRAIGAALAHRALAGQPAPVGAGLARRAGLEAAAVAGPVRGVHALAVDAAAADLSGGRTVAVHLALRVVDTLPVEATVAGRALPVILALRVVNALPVDTTIAGRALGIRSTLRVVDTLPIDATISNRTFGIAVAHRAAAHPGVAAPIGAAGTLRAGIGAATVAGLLGHVLALSVDAAHPAAVRALGQAIAVHLALRAVDTLPVQAAITGRALPVVLALGVVNALLVDTAIPLRTFVIAVAHRAAAHPGVAAPVGAVLPLRAWRGAAAVASSLGHVLALPVDAAHPGAGRVRGQAVTIHPANRLVDTLAAQAHVAGRAVPIVPAIDAVAVDADHAPGAFVVGHALGRIDALAVDALVVHRTVPVAPTLALVDAYALDAQVIGRAVGIDGAQRAHPGPALPIGALRSGRAALLVAAVWRAVTDRAGPVDAGPALLTVAIDLAGRIDRLAIAVDALVALRAVTVRDALRLEHAAAVNAFVARGTAPLLAGRGHALVVYADQAAGAIGVAAALLRDLDAGPALADIPRRALAVVLAGVDHLTAPLDALVPARAVGIAGARIAGRHADAVLADQIIRTVHVALAAGGHAPHRATADVGAGIAVRAIDVGLAELRHGASALHHAQGSQQQAGHKNRMFHGGHLIVSGSVFPGQHEVHHHPPIIREVL
ncbi:MAG: hypothetical protein LUQ37_00655, partial [Methanoregulaceae archaeon]|nr:hypothetical protein [Methanoregulaceae archaeon]